MSETPTSSASSASSVPSFVKDLDLHALASLATKTRSGDIDCAVDATPKVGAFNVVYFLEFADGLRWVARIPIAPWSEALQKRMSLDRISLDLSEPSLTLFMTFLPGTQLAKLWFDPLSSHEFSSIGQLDIDPTTLAHVGTTVPKPAGNPCTSTYVYFQSELIHQLKDASDITVISWLQLLRTFTGMLLDPALDGAPFFLSHPDLNYQNILVDEEGNVTGLIDWDDTCVVPRQCAFARYPSWITRDWDPLMYAYREASPVRLASSALTRTDPDEEWE
ncbi:hypothetical protein C8R46DRAFT_1123364 [Mycena filopes]|nr:hypothetical protein C8R46DRAFT_1123364 [Mycena filopes]